MTKLDWVDGLQNYLFNNPSYFREIPEDVLPGNYQTRAGKISAALKRDLIEVTNTGGLNVYHLPGDGEAALQKAKTFAPFTHKLQTPFFWKAGEVSYAKRQKIGHVIIRVNLSKCGGRRFFKDVGTIFYRPGEEESAADLISNLLKPYVFEDRHRRQSLSLALRQNLPQGLSETVMKRYLVSQIVKNNPSYEPDEEVNPSTI